MHMSLVGLEHPSHYNQDGQRNCLHLILQSPKQQYLFDFFMSYGLEHDFLTINAETPFSNALKLWENLNDERVKTLIEKGVEIDNEDKSGDTLFTYFYIQ